MPSKKNNGHKSTQNNQPRLSNDDLSAIKTFVTKAIQQPNITSASNPLPLATLIENDPATYRHAVDLLSRGCSLKAVSIACSLPLQTVKAMSFFIPDYQKISRDSTARNLSQASLRMSEILLERADELAPDKIAFALSITTERAELLGGNPTLRTETRHVVTREELQALFDKLPRARDVDSKLIDSSPNDSPQLPPAA